MRRAPDTQISNAPSPRPHAPSPLGSVLEIQQRGQVRFFLDNTRVWRHRPVPAWPIRRVYACVPDHIPAGSLIFPRQYLSHRHLDFWESPKVNPASVT
jgi:hypothetical protein